MAYTIQSFLEIIVPMARKNMAKTGVLASLTIAQAILESKYGNSGLTKSANNLFGIKGAYNGQSVTLPTTEYEKGVKKTIMAPFRKYPSWQDSLEDHSNFLKKYSRYRGVLNAKDYKEACHAIQAAGYATDPNYAIQLISLIEKYKLYEWDKKESEEKEVTQKQECIIGTITIELNGVQKEVETVNVEGFNYIKLRDLADAKILVDYDAKNKLPIIKVK